MLRVRAFVEDVPFVVELRDGGPGVRWSGGDENSGLLGRGRDGRSSEVALDHDGELCNSAPVRRERSSRCCVLELAEAFTDLRGHGAVLLALAAGNGSHSHRGHTTTAPSGMYGHYSKSRARWLSQNGSVGRLRSFYAANRRVVRPRG